MSDNRDQSHEDLLDRATAALRDTPVPTGPSPQMVFRTAEALREAAAKSKPSFARRILTMTLTQRIAAAVGISIGGLILYVIFVMFSTMGGTIAYADVAKQIAEARTLQCVMTVTSPDLPKPMQMQVLAADGGRARIERVDEQGRTIQIIDTGRGKGLALSEAQNLAFVIELEKPGAAADDFLDMLSKFRALAEKQGGEIGRKDVAGVKTVGFEVEHENVTWTIWADAQTGVPVMVETTARVMEMEMHLVMSDFVLNEPLDESLFDLTPPAGYTVQTMQMNAQAALEDEVVTLLREYSKATGGDFPARLDDWTGIAKALLTGSDSRERGREVAMTIGRHAGVITGTLSQLSPNDYAYIGGDAKLGEAEKIVFWYRVPGEQRYRAIFGDLSVEDVPRERVVTE